MRIRLKNSTGNHLQQRHDFHPSLYVFTESYHICLSRFLFKKNSNQVCVRKQNTLFVFMCCCLHVNSTLLNALEFRDRFSITIYKKELMSIFLCFITFKIKPQKTYLMEYSKVDYGLMVSSKIDYLISLSFILHLTSMKVPSYLNFSHKYNSRSNTFLLFQLI